MKNYKWVLAALFITLVIAGVISQFASPAPDGLERTAEDLGFAGKAKNTMSSPLPDYLFPGIKNEKLATALAGIAGVGITFGAVMLLGKAFGKNRSKDNKNGGISNV